MSIRNCGELGLNLQKIIKRLLANQNLLKLLFYTDKDPLNNMNLTEAQIQNEIYNNLIRIVPIITDYKTAQSTLSVRIISGVPDITNSEFVGIKIGIEVFVPMTQWVIKDSNLRPFAIMGEVQNSLSGKTINGLGKITSGGFTLNFLTEEISDYEMIFTITDYN